MSQFQAFAKAVEARFRAMSSGELFSTDVEDLFGTYLGAFPVGSNPIFRTRTEHDCSCCKNFVRNIGHLIALKDGKVETVWDVDPNLLPFPYDVVAAKLAQIVRKAAIVSVFRTKEGRYGAEASSELMEGRAHRWHHFWCDVPAKFRSTRPEEARGQINTVAQVFRRGLEELSLDAIDTVIDLINQNSLYRGAEHLSAVKAFRKLHHGYPRDASAAEKDVYVWSNINDPAARFRNTVIGTLVIDLSAGEELDKAVRSFESKVAPQNYKRTTALITPKMIDQAVDKLKELGLESAIERRFARIEDVSVNNVLFVDNSVKGRMKDGLAGLLMDQVKTPKVDIKGAEPIKIADFLSSVVPQASSIDLLVSNKHLSNFMSLTAPVHADAGRLFKWDNGFAWSYDGDAADSIKQRVKKAGGRVDGAMRVSLAWFNYDDLDLHVIEPRGGQHISYMNKGRIGEMRGVLDVDMNISPTTREPVENIVWTNRPRDGVYKVAVHSYTKRESLDVGFTLEVEYDGRIEHYTHAAAVTSRNQVQALEITVRDGRVVSIAALKGLVGGSLSQEKWGVNTETLVPVNTLLASPNHWDGQGVGNKHWFFILKGCLNPEPVRGIYNEFLKGELEPHRKVFEVLGAKTKCPVVPQQLSGIGFSSTRADEATVVVKGARINKAFNITF